MKEVRLKSCGFEQRTGGSRDKLSGFLRAVLALTLLIILPGCAYTLTGGARANPYDEDLHPLVGKTLTLDGIFWLNGKVGPYIERHSTRVYLVAHGSFNWSSNYSRVQGHVVKVTGELLFKHFEPATTIGAVDQPPDYFYFDVETAKIKLKYHRATNE